MGKIETATQWMLDLADDNTHGYSQDKRWGPDYDCSSAIITAWETAGVPVKSNGANATGSMYKAFLKSGFEDVTSEVNMTTQSGMRYGDVLLRLKSGTKSGHTVMYIGNNQIVHASTSDGHPESGDQTGKEICVRSYYNGNWGYVLRYTGKGSGGVAGDATIRAFQAWLNSNYSTGLTIDGKYGHDTKKAAIKAYQKILGVTADGVFGPASKEAVKILKAGSRGNDVHIMQGMLYCRGFNPNGVDGIFGSGCTTAVKKFQSSKGLMADGLAGKDTMYALYN